MKKVLTLIFVVALIALMPISAMAGKMLFIDEFYFFVTIPDGYYVFTRDKSESPEGWALLGEAEQEQLMQTYVDSNVYLNAVSKDDFSTEMVLTVIEGQTYKNIYNLNDFSDSKIKKELGKEWESTVQELGMKADSVEIYQNGDIKYFYTRGTVSTGGQTVYVMLYSTIVNGIMVQCNIRSTDGPLTSGEESELKQVVDSIHFTQILKNPNKSLGSSALGSALKWVIIVAVAGGVSAVANVKARKKGSAAVAPGQLASPAEQQPAAANIASGTVPVIYVCKNCGAQFNRLTAFCPNCGGSDTLVEKTGQ
ncbi:MAG: hypothetical protein K5771_02595 [Oscillospiraceae bacterium]|nr:hypothetical protein [Oscillospiraceae bacterium]